MPYVSQKQERYFNANRAKMKSKGVNVDEWNKASKGKKLPARAPDTLKRPMSKKFHDGFKKAFGR